MATQPQQSLNLFTQQPILGQAAFTNPGALQVIQAVVSATGSPSLAPGQAIKFDRPDTVEAIEAAVEGQITTFAKDDKNRAMLRAAAHRLATENFKKNGGGK